MLSVEMNFVKHFSSDRNCTEVEQKKQPGTTKLIQDMEVTVTQTNHEVSLTTRAQSFTLTLQ
jgi:hypothetical protein